MPFPSYRFAQNSSRVCFPHGRWKRKKKEGEGETLLLPMGWQKKSPSSSSSFCSSSCIRVTLGRALLQKKEGGGKHGKEDGVGFGLNSSTYPVSSVFACSNTYALPLDTFLCLSDLCHDIEYRMHTNICSIYLFLRVQGQCKQIVHLSFAKYA